MTGFRATFAGLPRDERAGLGLVLLLPLVLLHGRGVAEAAIMLIGLLFLARSVRSGDWGWGRRTWVRVAAGWWGWLVLCSALRGAEPVTQALGLVRFLLLVAALEHWLLRSAAPRRWLATLLRWSAFYIMLQCAVQLGTGRNLFGYPRGADGELTGPYMNPRAGAPLSRLLLPAVLPYAGRAWGAALLLVGLLTVLLIGQRMPFLLSLLGLFIAALLVPRLRGAAMFALVAAGLLLSVSAQVAPEAHHRLIAKFETQMADFPHSHYGQIAARAVAIWRASPILGAGFDGFRRLCDDPAYFRGWDGGDGGGAAICVQHPHNFYLQALVESGLPGLVLFCAMALAWLVRLGAGLWRQATPLRAGLFAAALIHLWPIASSTAFSSMPLGGWFFVLLGLGLAEARAYIEGDFPMPERA